MVSRSGRSGSPGGGAMDQPSTVTVVPISETRLRVSVARSARSRARRLESERCAPQVRGTCEASPPVPRTSSGNGIRQQSAGSAGIRSAPLAGASKNVAMRTVGEPVGLKAEWTSPCPASTKA